MRTLLPRNDKRILWERMRFVCKTPCTGRLRPTICCMPGDYDEALRARSIAKSLLLLLPLRIATGLLVTIEQVNMRVFVQHGACSVLACQGSDTVHDLKRAIERTIGERHRFCALRRLHSFPKSLSFDSVKMCHQVLWHQSCYCCTIRRPPGRSVPHPRGTAHAR